MKGFSLKYKLLVLTVFTLFLWTLAADMPFSFKAGEVISAEQVNGNFAALDAAKQERVAGECAEGSAIRTISADGTVTCETDDVGSGSSGGYTAGDGLKLSGTQFSIDPAKTQARVSASCAVGSAIRTISEDGKVECETDDVGSGGGGGTAGVSALNGMSGEVTLQAGDNITIDSAQKGQLTISATGATKGVTSVKADTGLSGGGTQSEVSLAVAPSYRLPQSCKNGDIAEWDGKAWICAKDDLGTGSAYSADNSSLILSGTTFAVKDGGVGTVKLAERSVTASKIALPLELTGMNSGSAVLLASNTNTSARPTGVHGRIGTGTGVVPGFGAAVWGESSNDSYGMFAYSASNISLYAQNGSLTAIKGQSSSSNGVFGESGSGIGVYGKTSGSGQSGVRGETAGTALGYGVSGSSTNGIGIYGESTNNAGIFGKSRTNNAAFFTGGAGGTGSCSYNGGAGWNCTSDKSAKENFAAIDSLDVLEQLAAMPLSTWTMKGDASRTPHLGPTAQDFYAAFGLGGSDVTINTADAQGVALAAIQGLYQLVQDQQAKIANLEVRLAAHE